MTSFIVFLECTSGEPNVPCSKLEIGTYPTAVVHPDEKKKKCTLTKKYKCTSLLSECLPKLTGFPNTGIKAAGG